MPRKRAKPSNSCNQLLQSRFRIKTVNNKKLAVKQVRTSMRAQRTSLLKARMLVRNYRRTNRRLAMMRSL